jgi:uncharacterized glyoxalase superfamily protein PhnB
VGGLSPEIGDSLVMVGGVNEQNEPTRSVLNLYIEDCDETYKRALDAGAVSIREPEDQFYGDWMAGVADPAGNSWWISTHIEDVPEDEMKRRAEAAQAK